MARRLRSARPFVAAVLGVFFLQASYGAPPPIALTYRFPKPVVNKNTAVRDNVPYDSVSVRMLNSHGAPSEPVMPFKTARILIPQNADVEQVARL